MSESGSEDIAQRIARLEHQDLRLTRALELLAERGATSAVKARRNWDAYAATIATFIGAIAVAIGAYTAYVQREQLRAQVWPRLERWESDINVGLYITNQGTGPASISRVRVKVDGVPLRTWSAVREATGLSGLELATSSLRGRVIPAGKDYTILQPMETKESRDKLRELLRGTFHTISVTICYCSVLKQCWTEPRGAAGEPGDAATDVDGPCPILAIEQFDD
jgi:hypothetical protein